jgi:hypothetical protein
MWVARRADRAASGEFSALVCKPGATRLAPLRYPECRACVKRAAHRDLTLAVDADDSSLSSAAAGLQCTAPMFTSAMNQ